MLRTSLSRPNRLRGSSKAGNAAKGNRFHKTVGNKETAVASGNFTVSQSSIPLINWHGIGGMILLITLVFSQIMILGIESYFLASIPNQKGQVVLPTPVVVGTAGEDAEMSYDLRGG